MPPPFGGWGWRTIAAESNPCPRSQFTQGHPGLHVSLSSRWREVENLLFLLLSRRLRFLFRRFGFCALLLHPGLCDSDRQGTYSRDHANALGDGYCAACVQNVEEV